MKKSAPASNNSPGEQLVDNPQARREAYPEALQDLLSIVNARQARRWLGNWPELRNGTTPVFALPGMAAHLGIAGIDVKDESVRSPLGSFKALGAPYALLQVLRRRWPDHDFAPATLLAGGHGDLLGEITVISATDGNQGRALAAAAQSVGCRCVIVLHAHVSPEREAPIAALGAQIVRVSGNYDDSVREARRLAQQNGWQVVSDTSYAGYEEIPRDVMQGYAVMADELLDALEPGAPSPWSHVFIQGGVGAIVAGVSSYFWQHFGTQRPSFLAVEPEQADCLLQSALLGQAATASGSVDSVMAGLACGEASPLAWRFLQPCMDQFVTVSDARAVQAMRLLAEPDYGDIPLLSGESGGAGFAALLYIAQSPELRLRAGIGPQSRVLLINTEGATAPGIYAALVGKAASEVVAAQSAWTARRTGASGATPIQAD